MVPITIGVPVYNGADLIGESLACLARQTFRDFKVLIFDNASTDGTAEIAKGWAARDDRFHYVRQPNNVGGIANFRDSLLAADTPWFMWRADDDLSADNYIEKLYQLATASPGCKLAVSTVVSCDLDGANRAKVPPPADGDTVTLKGRLRTLIEYPPSWFYGLWDTETARKACLPVLARYPFANAGDHLTLYGPIIDGAVRTTTETQFVQRIHRTATTERPKRRYSAAQLLEMRRCYLRELRRIRSERRLSLSLRAALMAIEPFYLRRRLPSLSKIARTRLRELLGVSGHSSAPAKQDT
jgi:glycosyltransferase involved in cell wall biosynthesis